MVYPTVGPQHQRLGPITREEHNLQLWYSGLLPAEEPRQQQEPQNLLGKSYEEYKQLYFLPEHVHVNEDKVEEQQRNQHDQHPLENQTRVERQQPHDGAQGDDATALQLGPSNDVIERRQGILGTGRILRATALAVS